MTSHVDAVVAARIAAARAKRQQRRQQRAELDEARGYGLQARHLAKMRRWQQDDETAGCGDTPTTEDLRSPAGHAGMGQSPTVEADRGDTPTVVSASLTETDDPDGTSVKDSPSSAIVAQQATGDAA
jgi:hypothetical protein